MNGWLIVADLLLAAGLTARLTRFVITDDLGDWWIRTPVDAWFHKPVRYDLGEPTETEGLNPCTGKIEPVVEFQTIPVTGKRMRWHRYLVMLTCPWCVGFWIAAAVLGSLALVGGPGDAAEPWRWVAGVFTLNWVVAHIGVRLGDAGYSDD